VDPLDELTAQLTGWAPAPVEVTGRIDGWPAGAFAALLDQPSPVRGPGDPLPPLWQGFHLLEHPAQADLGADGHPARGPFLPPLPDRRRMFAGGRLQVRDPLRVGDEVVRRSSLVSVTPRSGRSGAMVFVTVRHEFGRDGAVALVEEQDFAYRSQPAGAARGLPATAAAPAAAEPEPTAPGAWRVRLVPDAALLFRFSALTHNTHRIHYDHPYVTGVEGYPGLVVHGPLLALLLLELPRRFAPDRPVTGFSYRLRSPAFAGSPVVAQGSAEGELLAGVPGAPPSVTGAVTFGARAPGSR
jgi:3-methylfumaryl-CoA hydratase